MSNAVRSVVVRLSAETSGLVRGYRAATAETDKLKDSIAGSEKESKKFRSAVGDAGKVAGAVGLVAAAGFGVAITKAADFEQGMSNVEAATHASAATMEQYRQAAIDAGASTQYSATEAAGAVENLAKAGVDATDILGGGLAGSLDLAAAGGLDVASAAEIAATALTQFKLEGRDMTHVADLLAAGAGKAQGDVTDLAMALKQGGLVAAQTGLSIEETTGTLAAFASAGLLGSDAGTSMKTMLLALNPASDKAAALMKKYNLEAYDAQGNFVGMAKYAGKLRAGLSELSTEQRNAALKTIFGNDAIRAANILFTNGEKGVRRWTNAVNDQGYAAETAATKTDNLRGDVERLGGALDTAFIGTGSGAQAPLRDLIQNVTGLVDAYNDLPAPMQSATMEMLGYTAAVGGALFVGSKLIQGAANTRSALSDLGVMGENANNKLAAMRIGAGIAGGALLLLADNIGEVNDGAGYLASAAGGALMGFAAAGPIGGAIGAGAGLLFHLEKANDAATESFRRSIKFQEDYRNALEVTNGKIDDQVKKIVYRNLQNSGALGVGQDIGLRDRDLVGATLGDPAAIKRVTERVRELTAATVEQAASGKYMFNKESAEDFLFSLKNMGVELSEQQKAALRAAAATKTWREALTGIPKKVFTELKTEGFAPSVAQVMRLQQQYNLTPKQVTTIFRETGTRPTGQEVLQLQRRMRLTPKQVVTLVKQTGARLTAQEVQQLQRRYDLTPKQVRTFLRALDEASPKIRQVGSILRGLDGDKATVKIVTQRITENIVNTANDLAGLVPGLGKAPRAYGGPMGAYQDYLVGEVGPEIVRTQVPARVIPNNQLARGRAMPSSAGSSAPSVGVGRAFTYEHHGDLVAVDPRAAVREQEARFRDAMNLLRVP